MQKVIYKSGLIFLVIIKLGACGQNQSVQKHTKPTNTITILAKAEKMDTAYFWKIMDYAFEKGKFDNKLKEQAIMEQLVILTPAQIQDFEIIFQQLNKKASTWEVFAAQTIIEEGSSDDRFYYFRCWLMSLGQKNFEAALKNPDYLASLSIPFNEEYGEMYCQFEELIPMADNAYALVTKKNRLTDMSFPRPNADKLGLFYDSNTDMIGNEWHDVDLPKILPLLYKKYAGK